MKIVWLPAARSSRRAQIAYIAERNPRAALAMADSIRSAIGQLITHPHIGRIGRVSGTRELVVPRTPFIVVYEVQADAVRVIRVLHSSQHWPAAH